MRHALSFLAALMLVLTSARAMAQQAVPGDACATNGYMSQSTGPELSGAGHFMLCVGGTWRAIYSYNNAAQITKIGDQICGTNQILKFNGTTWACAADNEIADNLGNHTATANLTMGANAIVNAGPISTGPWNSTYDAWYQGSVSSTTGGARNLALVGTDEDSGDTLYVNFNGEYAGGTIIGDDVVLGGTAAPAAKLDLQSGSILLANGGQILARDTGGTIRSAFIPRHTDGHTYIDSGGVLHLRTNNGTVMGVSIDILGHVGIGGVAGPSTRFLVNSSTAALPNINGVTAYGKGNYSGVVGLSSDGVYYGALGRGDGFSFVGNGKMYNVGLTNSNGGYYVCWNNEFYYSVTACSFSDERLKQNIKPVEGALEKIARLRGVSYEWKDEARRKVAGRQLGLLAQDVEKEFPDAVKQDPVSGYKSVDYDGLIGSLVEAIKELKADNEALRKDFDSYKTLHP
ncbi:MAG: tail fiber domain-containing protein [Xanthobacteraceae bacterium]